MNAPRPNALRFPRPPVLARWLLCLPALALSLAAAGVASAAASADKHPPAKGQAEQAYRQQRADCEAGRTGQDLATCLKEAGAARAEARRGTLDSAQGQPEDLAANRLLRCQRLPPVQRPDCERLARGEGSSSGSVQGGGVIKTLVTRSVGASAPTPATADPAASR